MLANASPAFILPKNKSETRIEVPLLVAALFLQRFSLPFQNTFLMLDIVPVALVLLYHFLSGKLSIQVDRLLWFLAAALAATLSLLLNFKSTMLASYLLFLTLYSLVTLIRPCTTDTYKKTLLTFQLLVMVLSCVAMVQFAAQFFVNGRDLIMFYGILPDILFGPLHSGGMNTIHVVEGESFLKSNAMFLAEASNLSQITALGILIEVLEFRRLRYLVTMSLGFLLAYSGVGMMVLLIFLPLASLRHEKALLSALFVLMSALGLFAIGLIDLSVFLSRVDEFNNTSSSGFQRFIAPWWVLAIHFDIASLQAILIGNGPGTSKVLYNLSRWWAPGVSSWLKWVYEYGIVGSFLFVCFCASCFRRSRCPRLVLAALIFLEVTSAGFLTTWFLTVVITLATLHEAEPRRGRGEAVRRHPCPSSSLPTG
jgi:hypothetical protein